MTDCRVYWGTHGCELERGHEGEHRCDCGSTGYGPLTQFYGEDATKEERTFKPRPPCPECGRDFGDVDDHDAHDPCIRDLPGVLAACCGHGNTEEAYILFKEPYEQISGIDALVRMRALGGLPPKPREDSNQRSLPKGGAR